MCNAMECRHVVDESIDPDWAWSQYTGDMVFWGECLTCRDAVLRAAGEEWMSPEDFRAQYAWPEPMLSPYAKSYLSFRHCKNELTKFGLALQTIITHNGRSGTLTAVQSGVQFGRDEVEDRIRMVYERGSEEHARFN